MSRRLVAQPGPETVLQTQLSNGLQLLVRENHSSPVAVLHGALRVGSVYDSPAQAGLASFVAGMLTRGSEQYDYDRFNAAVETIGASLTVTADTHSTDFSITCLAEDFLGLLALLADSLRHPTFPDDQLERLRRRRRVQLQEREQDTASVATRHCYEALFGRSHPYGQMNDGYPETVTAFQRGDLVRFHAHHYSPQGAVLAVAGDVDPSQVAEVVEQCFGDWQTPTPAQPTIERIRRTDAPCIRVAMANKVQSDLVVGTYAVPRSDPAFYALRVANTLLGQFGMMGRLGERVREEEGLAYYCYSSFVAEQEDGVWLAAAGVPPTAVDAALESILSEFERLGTQPVPADELADSQAYLTGVVPLTLETNDGVASTLLSIAWHNLGLDYLQRYPGLIYGVPPSDVQQVAATYLDPRRCVRAIAGPEEP